MKKIPSILFITVLIFAPLAFGTVEQWSMLTVEILIALLALSYCIQVKKTSAKLLSVPGLIPLLLLAGWMLLQMLPLPVFWVKVLSPASYQVYKPVYDLLAGNPWMPLTVNQKATSLELIRILSYILFYILTIQLLSCGERLKQTVKLCSWLAIGIAVMAILQNFTAHKEIYWFRPVPSFSYPVGPWVYRSHYAAYIEMMAPLVLALCLYYRPPVSTESWRSRIVTFFTMTGGNLSLLLGLGFLTLVLSVFISLCRGGIIALSLSFLVFYLILARKKGRYSGLFFIGIAVSLLLAMAWFGWEPILARFDQVFTSTGQLNFDRLPIWQDTFKIVRDYWLTGSGFGTFVYLFPSYRTIPGDYVFYHPLNEFIEAVTDGGVIAFGLFTCFMTVVLREGWRMIGKRRDRYSILISIGSLTGIIATLIHNNSDFNMHNWANGLYFFFLCGLLVSAGNTRLQYQTESTLLPAMAWPSKRHLLVGGLVFFCAVLLGPGRSLLALWKYDDVGSIYLSRQLAVKHLHEVASAVEEAAHLDPLNGMYPFFLGDVETYLRHPDQALASYLQAGTKNPLEGAFLQKIALALPKGSQGHAEILMEKGAERALIKDGPVLAQVQWLLEKEQRAKAIEAVRKRLVRNPQFITSVLPLLQAFSFSREEMVSVLPDSVNAWMLYGAYCQKSGNLEDTRFFYGQALDFLANETTIQAGWFSELYNFYRTEKEDRKALDILRLGAEKMPDYAPFHIWLGDYYAREGVTYRAREEFQHALLLEPKNESVKKKIEMMAKSENQ